MLFTGIYLVLLGFTGFYWVLPKCIGFEFMLLVFLSGYKVWINLTNRLIEFVCYLNAFYWDLPSFTGFYRVLPKCTGFAFRILDFYLIVMVFTEFYWVLPGSTGLGWAFTWLYWALPSCVGFLPSCTGFCWPSGWRHRRRATRHGRCRHWRHGGGDGPFVLPALSIALDFYSTPPARNI